MYIWPEAWRIFGMRPLWYARWGPFCTFKKSVPLHYMTEKQHWITWTAVDSTRRQYMYILHVYSTCAVYVFIDYTFYTTQMRYFKNSLLLVTSALSEKSPPFARSIPLLRSLHWLPVRLRILFKINLLTYKTLREKQPVYLHSMLAASIPSRPLRSNNDNSLSIPRVQTDTGARAFHSCASSLWNNLPLSVCSVISVATFKKYLKTNLFDLAFSP